MNKRLFPLVQAAMIAAALIGGNAASIVSAEDAPVIPQETALTDSAEPEAAADEPAETPEEPESPAEPEIEAFAAEPEEAALEALMSAPESEPIEPEIVQAAAETLSAMPTARKAAALKAMRPVTYVPEGLPEGVTLSVDVPPAAFSEPVEIYARFLTDPEDGSFSEDIIAAAQTQYEEALAACEEGYSAGVMLFDLSFVNEAGEEVEPALPVSVYLAFPEVSEDVEITGVRHFTDAENVEVYEDLDFTAVNNEELTLNYITESCSSFTVTWSYHILLVGDFQKILNVIYVDDDGNTNRVNPSYNDLPYSQNEVLNLSSRRKEKDTSTGNYEGLSYKYVGTLTSLINGAPPSSSTDNRYLVDCNYVQYFDAELDNRYDGWCYSVDSQTGYGAFSLYGKLTNWRSFVTNAQTMGKTGETVDSRDLYLVYYPLMQFHYGVYDAATDVYTERGKEDRDGDITLGDDSFANIPEYNDPTQYKLYICTDPEHPYTSRQFEREEEVNNRYRIHPEIMKYYFVYVKVSPPAPTGVTQKAAPYAAMVILAAVTAAVMIKRRKGGDVDETSPL